jgi:putative peptidoglycan lipid II flippase
MGVVLWAGQAVMVSMFVAGPIKYLGLAILVAIGMGAYFAAGVLMGAFSMSDLKGAVRRQR